MRFGVHVQGFVMKTDLSEHSYSLVQRALVKQNSQKRLQTCILVVKTV